MNQESLALRREHSRAILADEHKCDEQCALYHAPEDDLQPNFSCDDPEPHGAHEGLGGTAWCEGVPDLKLRGMAALEHWLASDYECNNAEFLVTSTGPEHEDDDSEEGSHVVGLGITYEVKLSEVGLHGDQPDDAWGNVSMTTYQHYGYGDTMDEAAEAALKMLEKHNEMLHPMFVIPASDATASDTQRR